MPPDLTIHELNEGVTELRTVIDAASKSGFETPEQKVRLDKINVTLDAQEKLNDVVAAKLDAAAQDADKVKQLEESLEARDKSISEINNAVEVLQAEIARGNEKAKSDPKAYKKSEAYLALNEYCKTLRLPNDMGTEKALLRVDSAVSAGVLVPSELESFITREIFEVDPFDALARTRNIDGKSIEIPVHTTLPVASMLGEAEAGSTSVPAYRLAELTPVRATIGIPLTADIMQSAAFDMDSEASTTAGLAFGIRRGIEFVGGSGAKGPLGFLSDTDIPEIESKLMDVVDGDDIFSLEGELKEGYNPTLLFNRLTRSALRKLRADQGGGGGTGEYLWAPALDGVGQNTIGGVPYRIMPSMPNIGDDTTPIALGDWLRSYTIVNRIGISVLRDPFTQAASAITNLWFHQFFTGQPTVPEGIVILRTT